MTLEVVVALMTLASGAALLRRAGLRDWGLLPLGFIVGMSVITLVGTAQVALGLPSSPVLTYAVAAGGPLLWWLHGLLTDQDVRIPASRVALVAAALVPAVAALRAANMARITPDSFNLAMTGSLMEGGHIDTAHPVFWESWQVGMGAIHGVANLQGELYLQASTPMLALATVAALIWFIRRAGVVKDSALSWALAGASAAVLVTIPRFVYHAFYLNRHMFLAAAVLVAAVAVWGLVADRIAPRLVLLTLLVGVLPGLVLSRGETPVVAALIALPLLTADRTSPRDRSLIYALLGTTTLLWYAPLAGRYAAADLSPSTASLAMIAIGAAMLLAAAVLLRGWAWCNPLPRWTPHAVEILLWAALLVTAVLSPQVLYRSVVNTWSNVAHGTGGWGISLFVVGLMALTVLVLTREGDRLALRFPMTAFLPYALLLAYVRAPGGLPYRDAPGDSLNRMLMHLVPLAILYIATSPAAKEWRFSTRRLLEGTRS